MNIILCYFVDFYVYNKLVKAFFLLGTPFLILSGAGSKTGGVPSPAIEPRRERSPMAGLHELLRPPGLLAQITRSESPLYTFDLEPFPDILKHFYFKYNILLFLSNSTILSTRSTRSFYSPHSVFLRRLSPGPPSQNRPARAVARLSN